VQTHREGMTNQDTITALYAAFNAHQLDRLPALFVEPQPGLQAAIAGLIVAFPDIHYTIADLTADGDRVAVRWTWTGTHTGPYRGIPATGKPVANDGMAIYTLRAGKIASLSMLTDRLGFLQQLGLAPADGAPFPAIDPARAGVFLIDTFTLPAAARAEFEATMKRNRAFLRTLDGFRGDAVFVTKQGEAFDIATIAAWANADAIAHAKDQVAAYYAKLGFDLPAAIAKWGVKFQRTIATAPGELQ